MVFSASPSCIPLHCIICFDEFDLVERPPVVLPCGHTYLCAPCSKRLTKCMECRMPLNWCSGTNAPQHQPPPPPFNMRPSSKLDGMGLISSPPSIHRRSYSQMAESQNVHMPKNVVLMALLESSLQQRQKARSGDEEAETETSHVSRGIEGMNSSCGTFAVREEGLAVLPQHPSRRDDRSGLSGDEDTDSRDCSESEPLVLKRGQRVQVTRMENGVATLARNEGYIVASSNELVKVGAPLESSCKLRGSLEMVETRIEETERELRDLRELHSDLNERLGQALQEEPSHPVISQASTWSSPSTPDEAPQTPEHRPTGRSGYESPRNSPRETTRPLRDPVTPLSTDTSEPHENQEVTVDFSCSTILFGISLDAEDSENTTPTLRAPSWTNNVSSSSSFDSGIDWRTGMSGHRALLSSKINSSPAYRGEIRMMSQHNGIARVGRLARRKDSFKSV